MIHMINHNWRLNILNTTLQAEHWTWMNVKLGSEKFRERFRNTFCEDISNLEMGSYIRSTFQKKRVEETTELMDCSFMYVEVWVNHRVTRNTTVDSKATHNSMTETKAKWLNILWHQDAGKMKIINLTSLPVLGVAKRTPIKLGTWIGQTDFAIVKMDEFDIVLRTNFQLKHRVIPMPLAKSLVITGSNPIIIKKNTH